MRALSIFLLASVAPAWAAAQPVVIDHTKARTYVNEEVTLEGPVARVDRSGRSLWFSLGRPHPSSTVVIIVPEEFASSYSDPRSYEGATVRVRGRLASTDLEGIGIDRGSGVRLSGPKPRSPFIVLEDPSRMTIVAPKPKEPKPDAAKPKDP
jgi:hypothetical protein